MTPEQFFQKLVNEQNQIKSLVKTKLPRMIGKIAVDHFKENFRKGGFVNGGLQKWKPVKRFDADSQYAAGKYGTLLSGRKELYNSITFDAGSGTVTIKSDKEYAQIHNEGGVTHPTVTDKMKNFAWAMHKKTGKKESKWKGIALTKKSNLTVNIPQRQFIGDSRELNIKIKDIIEIELTKIFE